jgi:hypothetical protein
MSKRVVTQTQFLGVDLPFTIFLQQFHDYCIFQTKFKPFSGIIRNGSDESERAFLCFQTEFKPVCDNMTLPCVRRDYNDDNQDTSD